MRKLIICLLFLPHLVCAESSVWRLESPKGVVYLAGSIHVLRSQDYPLPPEFDSAYADAQLLVFETDLDPESQQKTQQMILLRGSYGGGETIKDHLSVTVYQHLVEYCRRRNLPLDRVERLRPWLLVATLTMVEMQAEDFDADVGLDIHFFRQARRAGLGTDRLETMEEQIDALSAFDGRGDPLIADFLEEADSQGAQVEEMVRAWRSGDAKGLERLVVRDLRDRFPDLYRVILVERNRRWLPALEALAKSGKRALVIVGAAHLVGDDGLIALLRQRGYRVEKLVVLSKK